MKQTSSIIRWALIASLCLNLFSLSYYMGGYHLPAFLSKGEASMQSTLRGAVLQLSPQGRQIFKKHFLDNGDLILETKQEMTAKRIAMLQKMGQAEFDAVAIRDLMRETANLTSATHKGMQTLLLKTAQELSPEDRKLFSETLLQSLQEQSSQSLLGGGFSSDSENKTPHE